MKFFNFLAFEGGEGTGKTVLSKAVAKRIGAFWTYEPNGDTGMLLNLRKLALTQNPEMTRKAREMLMMANRSIHNKNTIEQVLKNKDIVVTDRSFFSGMVYAKIEGMSFEEWFELYALAHIEYKPGVIVYVRNPNRKIEKEVDNIYDHASEETLNKIDSLYEEGLSFISTYHATQHIRVIEFNNNFNLSVEENVDLVLEQISIA